MYLDYFGLNRFPFTIAPDPEFLFPSPGHQEALAHLQYALTGHGGLISLTGEVGTGKTTLCRAFLASVPDDVLTAYIFNPQLSALELLQSLCTELHIPFERADSWQELYARLNETLLACYARGQRVICVIDEAQSMPAPLLEQIRLLTNLETDKEKLLTLILVGQPELRELLARHELRQLNQRITARYHLRHLSETETRAYLRHRLATAGCDAPIFTEAAGKLIWQGTGGVPRLINSVADRALLGAYASNQKTVSPAIARQARLEVLGEQTTVAPMALPPSSASGRHLVGILSSAGAAALLILLGVLAAPRLTLWWQHWQGSGTTTIVSSPVASTGTAEPPVEQQALQAAFAEPAVAVRQDPVELLATRLSLQGRSCEQLQPEGWQCLWVEWPRGQLEDFRFQVAVQDFRGEWLPLDKAGDASIRERALLIWQPPSGYQGLVRPGQSAAVVPWIRATLGVEWHGNWQVIGPAGQSAASTSMAEQLYDPLLANAVAEFQARHGLDADRIVGPQTLLYLQRTLAPAVSGGQ